MNAIEIAAEAPPSAYPAPDIVRRFLVWAQGASSEERAEAASALARAYLYSDLTPPMRAEAMVAMTALLDDPCVSVRRALSEALAGAREAPRHLTLALANDLSEVAAAVLARSSALTDAELVDCAAIGDVVAQCAIARRPKLGAGPAAALAEIGKREAAFALVANVEADLSAGAMRRFYERFGEDPEAREVLLARPSLPVSLKADIAMATATTLGDAAAEWLGRERSERVAREARDQTIALIAASCPSDERAELARGLRERGALTVALLLRSLLSGERCLFAAALAELAGVAPPRVAALLRNPRGEGFAALARRAGLARHVLTTFRAALCALEGRRQAPSGGLELPLVEQVIAACEEREDPALSKILSLLWRFAAEAARAEARDFAHQASVAARAPRLPQSLDFPQAANDRPARPPVLAVAFDPSCSTDEASNLAVTLEEAANDQSGQASPLTFVLDATDPEMTPGDRDAALEEPPDDEPPPSFVFDLSHLTGAARERDAAAEERRNDGGEAPPSIAAVEPSDATEEASQLGAALPTAQNAAPRVELPIDLIGAVGRAA